MLPGFLIVSTILDSEANKAAEIALKNLPIIVEITSYPGFKYTKSKLN